MNQNTSPMGSIMTANLSFGTYPTPSWFLIGGRRYCPDLAWLLYVDVISCTSQCWRDYLGNGREVSSQIRMMVVGNGYMDGEVQRCTPPGLCAKVSSVLGLIRSRSASACLWILLYSGGQVGLPLSSPPFYHTLLSSACSDSLPSSSHDAN
jgi:hypothetical protein